MPDFAAIDKRYVWHPFTQMQDWLADDSIVIESGRGVYLRDTNGNDYIDGVSYSGGEPLMYFDKIEPVARAISSTCPGVYQWLYTNGILVDEDKLQRMRVHNKKIPPSMSISGALRRPFFPAAPGKTASGLKARGFRAGHETGLLLLTGNSAWDRLGPNL